MKMYQWVNFFLVSLVFFHSSNAVITLRNGLYASLLVGKILIAQYDTIELEQNEVLEANDGKAKHRIPVNFDCLHEGDTYTLFFGGKVKKEASRDVFDNSGDDNSGDDSSGDGDKISCCFRLISDKKDENGKNHTVEILV